MKNKQYKRLIDKSLKLAIATIFSFSLVNSSLVAKFTDINEFGSVAFAKSKEEKAAEKCPNRILLPLELCQDLY